jgi:hypothetical protein
VTSSEVVARCLLLDRPEQGQLTRLSLGFVAIAKTLPRCDRLRLAYNLRELATDVELAERATGDGGQRADLAELAELLGSGEPVPEGFRERVLARIDGDGDGKARRG